jgi:hypothetical protein
MFGADRMLNGFGQYCLPRDDGGAWDYFPFGSWGAGYRIGAAERSRLCNVQRVMEFFRLAVAVALGVVVVLHFHDHDLIAGIGVVAAVLAMSCLDRIVRWLAVRQLPLAERRLTATEVYLARAQRLPRGDWIKAAWSAMTWVAWILLMAPGTLDSWERGEWFLVPILLASLAYFVAVQFDLLAVFWLSCRLRGQKPT